VANQEHVAGFFEHPQAVTESEARRFTGGLQTDTAKALPHIVNREISFTRNRAERYRALQKSRET
jgi:hypothetical protein